MSDMRTRPTSPALPSEVVRPRPAREDVPTQQQPEEVQPTQEPEAPRGPIPTMGFPKIQYLVMRMFRQEPIPPKLSKKEAAIVTARELAADSLRYTKQLIDACTHLSVAYVGVKGAAATTTTMVNSASILADDTRTLVYGADFNPASGTAGVRLGKDYGETISIQKFAEMVDRLGGDRRAVNALLRPTDYGVRVLSADNYTDLVGETYGTTTAKMLDILDENCDYLLLDTPNDITTPQARAILRKADMIVFTANVGERNSLQLLRTSMDTVRALGYTQKVVDSVVVISGASKEATYDDYKKYLGEVNIRHEVTRDLQPGEFEGQTILVPYDPVIALNEEVNLQAYNKETIQAYRDINIAILEQALQIRERANLRNLNPANVDPVDFNTATKEG